MESTQSSRQSIAPDQERWRPWLALAVLCLVLANWPILLGKIVFFRDLAHWNLPTRWFLRHSWMGGELPTWDPLRGLGLSALTNPLYGIFYPPNWLFVLGGPATAAGMLTWQCLAHLVWGGIGTFAVARRLGALPAAAFVAAVTWGLCGYTVSQWSAGFLLLADAWIPWMTLGSLGVLDGARGRAWGAALWKAALPVAAVFLLGEIFLALIGAGFAGIVALTVSVCREPRACWPEWARYALSLVLAAALGIGIAAVVLLPAGLTAAATERGAPLSAAVAEACSLHPVRLLELVAPWSMGHPYGHYPAGPWVGEPLLDGVPLSQSIYLGSSVLALALAALGGKRNHAANGNRRVGIAFGILVIVSLLLAMGKYTPVHSLLRAVVRPLAYMRYPDKYLVLPMLLSAWLAALGATRILSGAARPWGRTVGLIAGLSLLAAVAPWFFPVEWARFVRGGAFRGAVAALAILCSLWLLRSQPRLAGVLTLAAVVFDLASASWPVQEFAPLSLAYVRPQAASAILAGHGARAEPPRFHRDPAVTPEVWKHVKVSSEAEVEAVFVRTLNLNLPALYGIAAIPGYDAAMATEQTRLWERTSNAGYDRLRLFSVDYTMLPTDPRTEAVAAAASLTPIMDPMPGARLYRVRDPLPRVYLAGGSEIATDDAATARITEPAVLAGELALLPPTHADAALAGPDGRAGTCMVVAFSNRRLAASCQASRAALAVFVEQHAPGWRARVDGVSAPLLRANVIMRAVAIGPGNHEIVLEQEPPGLGLGVAVSLTSLLLVGLLALWPWLRGKLRARRFAA